MHKHGGDIYDKKVTIDFSSNINPFGMTKRVKQAAVEAIDSAAQYPDPDCTELRRSLAEYEGVVPDKIRCGSGAAELIFSLAAAEKPKKVLIPAPTFSEYEQAVRSMGAEVEYFYLDREEGFRLNETFLDRLKTDLDMVFLCNPNNPTGVLTDRRFMEKVLFECEKKNILLIVDECFMEFISESEQHSLKKYIEKSSCLLLLKAFTKLYAMPGLRLGYVLSGNEHLLLRMREVTQPWSVSAPAEAGGRAAVEERNYVKDTRKFIEKENLFLKESLSSLGFRIYDSAANYVFFSGEKGLKERLLEYGVLIRDCSNYEGLEAGDYRAAVKSEQDNRILIERLKEIVGERNG